MNFTPNLKPLRCPCLIDLSNLKVNCLCSCFLQSLFICNESSTGCLASLCSCEIHPFKRKLIIPSFAQTISTFKTYSQIRLTNRPFFIITESFRYHLTIILQNPCTITHLFISAESFKYHLTTVYVNR